MSLLRITKSAVFVSALGLSTGLLAPAAFAATPTPITATPPAVQKEINKQLHDFPGGKQVGPRKVEYDGGDVYVVWTSPKLSGAALNQTFSQQSRTASVSPDATVRPTDTYLHGCPEGTFTKWFCYYTDSYWNESYPETPGKRMLQFKGSGVQNMSTYGFNDEASSWVNTTNRSVDNYFNSGGGSFGFRESPSTSSATMGRFNDEISSFRRN